MAEALKISDPVVAPERLRVLLTAGATAAWYDTDDEVTRASVAERWKTVVREWSARPGVRLIATFDDDLFLAGDPRPFGRWSIFILFEVASIDDAVAMIDDMRHGDIRLHKYFTMAATLGRTFWPADEGEST